MTAAVGGGESENARFLESRRYAVLFYKKKGAYYNGSIFTDIIFRCSCSVPG